LKDFVLLSLSKEIPIIIKADVGGSIEALTDAINRIPQIEFKLRIVSADVGPITDKDIEIATLTDPKAIILGKCILSLSFF
jgi:translation initiation factor IF-2